MKALVPDPWVGAGVTAPEAEQAGMWTGHFTDRIPQSLFGVDFI